MSTPQKRNRLGNITRIAPRADSKKRQWDSQYGDLVFFGREPAEEFPELRPVEVESKLWYPKAK